MKLSASKLTHTSTLACGIESGGEVKDDDASNGCGNEGSRQQCLQGKLANCALACEQLADGFGEEARHLRVYKYALVNYCSVFSYHPPDTAMIRPSGLLLRIEGRWCASCRTFRNGKRSENCNLACIHARHKQGSRKSKCSSIHYIHAAVRFMPTYCTALQAC